MANTPKSGAMTGESEAKVIRLISHSTNLYLYPIWLVGLVLALVTYLDRGLMVVVPEGTEARRDWRVEIAPGQVETREGLILHASDSRQQYHLPPADRADSREPLPPPEAPHVRMSHRHWLGTWFLLTMLIVFAVTSRGNEPVRGIKFYIGALLIAFAVNTLIFYRHGEWMGLLSSFLRGLHVQINFAGYMLVSTWLLVVWLTSVLFDRLTYIEVKSGQVSVKKNVGDSEVKYNASHVVLERQPRNVLRHGIIGLWCVRDIVIRIGGPDPQVIEWPNVICHPFSKRLDQVEHLLKTQHVEADR